MKHKFVEGIEYIIKGTMKYFPHGFGAENRDVHYTAKGIFYGMDNGIVYLRKCTLEISGKPTRCELRAFPYKNIE